MGGSHGAAFSGLSQNPEFMAAIGKSFANQTLTLSKMVEDDERRASESRARAVGSESAAMEVKTVGPPMKAS